MSDWLPDTPRTLAFPTASYVPLAGADWLASASPYPRSVHALWAARPAAPSVLPCGTAFDVINAPALFGRRMVDRLWSAGPGSGPVAAHRGRILLFAAPGTAQRLPALLAWEEWAAAVPPLLCHGSGDAVTVPPLYPRGAADGADQGGADAPAGSRWLVAPDVRIPWLPGPDILLWACVRAARAAAATGHGAEAGADSIPQRPVSALSAR
ncbi:MULTISPECIES: bifunctional DNA primase/polymerase [Streptomyces]|uniref:bifunctional DNA primase/polymerase n=1 Tax=Streptomyces TaxID=1883 RepID=UPI000B9EE0E1|nr:bifunctional DNA primase/polymerase [Streptomyces kasugaensis]